MTQNLTCADVPDFLTITKPVRMEFVRVPAGEFLMGSDPAKNKEAHNDELPQHRVCLSEFYIGKYPVTNTQYAAFVEATGYEVQKEWIKTKKEGSYPVGGENHPATYVIWYDAVAFCNWFSQESGHIISLPTEAEWEKAARGTDGRTYPWGQGIDSTRANYWGKEKGKETTPVDAHPAGISPYGALDMAGNIWEWINDWYDADYYAKSPAENPTGPQDTGSKVVRGGSWHYVENYIRTAYRDEYLPGNRSYNMGFRCRIIDN